MYLDIISLTYFCRGHSRNYIDNLLMNLESSIKVNVFVYGNEQISEDDKIIGCNGDPKFLGYRSAGRFAAYLKIISRFIASFKLFWFFNKNIRLTPNRNDRIFYFMDYEYLSLAIFLLLFYRKQEKMVWIHSSSLIGNLFYRVYKGTFFRLMKNVPNVTYIVNGDYSKELLKSYNRESKIYVIQYPSSKFGEIVEEEKARKKLGISADFVFSLVGMIRRNKEYEKAIRCFSQSEVANKDNICLLIAGSLEDVTEEDITNWLVKYNLKNVKTIFKYFDDEYLSLIFSLTNCLLLPYGSKGDSQSGPLSACREYLVPAISFMGGEVGSYIKREGVGIVAESEETFVNSINCIVERDKYISVQKALEISQHKYSWNSTGKMYESILNNISRKSVS